ncbi:hypothetical protein [Saccharopolyspora sp. SCSIO 74807]|uniref:hypothetical protein n=1 Tax=Saccharopolyspora sp. SCSIO 74807 TaxID=3118084 RepID=UPI0030D25F06
MPRDNTDDDVVEHLFDVRLGGRSPGHLSWNTPFANMPLRYATADIDLGAVTIPSGAAILAAQLLALPKFTDAATAHTAADLWYSLSRSRAPPRLRAVPDHHRTAQLAPQHQ